MAESSMIDPDINHPPSTIPDCFNEIHIKENVRF